MKRQHSTALRFAVAAVTLLAGRVLCLIVLLASHGAAAQKLPSDVSIVPLLDGERQDPSGVLSGPVAGSPVGGARATIVQTMTAVRSGAGAFEISTNGPIAPGESDFIIISLTGSGASSSHIDSRDLSGFGEVRFWLRNDTGTAFTLGFEMKDWRDDHAQKAGRAFSLGSTAEWIEIVVPLDLADGWEIVGTPDLRRAKSFVLVIQNGQGTIDGSLFLDDMVLVERTGPLHPEPAAREPVPMPALALDAPVDESTVPASFTIRGWAIDRGAAPGRGTGVDAVRVYAHPNPGSGAAPVFLGAATYGTTRSDIGALFGSQFEHSGFALSASGLPAGSYQITAEVRSTVSGTFSATVSAIVTVMAPQPDPVMSLDGPADNSTVGPNVTIAGWAIDRGSTSGTGVDAVQMWAYPNGGGAAQFLGAARYGLPRADIGGALGSRFTNSGFRSTVTMNPGTYRIVALGRSTVTDTFVAAVSASNVIVQAANTNAVVFVDAPGQHTAATRPFTVSGWAIDAGANIGTGIDAVHVWAFPADGTPATFVGVATYGTSRPDVGPVFGDIRFNESGFTFTAASWNLAAGTYDLVVSGRSTVTGGFTVARVVRVNVQ